MLEYDNSAFYYFAMTLMCMYLLPSTWNVMSEVYKALFSSVQGESRTEAEKQKMDRIRTESAGLKRLTKRGFLINLVCLLVTWAIFGYFLYLVLSTEGTVQEYNPYSILGVDIGATTSEIKKAYRKMSLKYHPDKNIGNKDAEEMFKKVAKAHEALTDEVAKENYAKYGNPDGRQQSMEVSIGLPTILLENPKVVLVLYLVGMVIVIPTGMWSPPDSSHVPVYPSKHLYLYLLDALLCTHSSFPHPFPSSFPLRQPWLFGTTSPSSSAKRTFSTTRIATGST